MSFERYRTGELYGLAASYGSPDALREAATRLWIDGYRKVTIYSPFPIEDLEELFESTGDRVRFLLVALFVLGGGVGGGLTAILIQEWANVWSYPLVIAGRPYNSWPSFVPVTFELTILGAALAGLAGLLILNGLPQMYHPMFNLDSFVRASQDRYVLCVAAEESRFEAEGTARLLAATNALAVEEVRW